MADRTIPLDVAGQAVRIGEMENLMALQGQSTRQSIENMSNTLAGLGSEVRQLVASVHELAMSQATNQRDREAITDLKKNFADLNARLEDWFTDYEQRQDARWREHERNRDEWRAQHTEANRASSAAVWTEVHRLDRQMVLSRGWLVGAGFLSTLLLSGALWVLNDRFQQASNAIDATVKTAQYNRELIDRAREKQHEIELYLARGGARRDEPYPTAPKESPR
jgi:hypothetical protein